jgi:hypothetical protein
MERTEMLIYIVIFVIALLLVIKYWKTGQKN